MIAEKTFEIDVELTDQGLDLGPVLLEYFRLHALQSNTTNSGWLHGSTKTLITFTRIEISDHFVLNRLDFCQFQIEFKILATQTKHFLPRNQWYFVHFSVAYLDIDVYASLHPFKKLSNSGFSFIHLDYVASSSQFKLIRVRPKYLLRITSRKNKTVSIFFINFQFFKHGSNRKKALLHIDAGNKSFDLERTKYQIHYSMRIDFFTNRTRSSIRFLPVGFVQSNYTQPALYSLVIQAYIFRENFLLSTNKADRNRIELWVWFVKKSMRILYDLLRQNSRFGRRPTPSRGCTRSNLILLMP
jgi:hypothetical protein